MLGIPILILYEMSILSVVIVERRRKKSEEDKEEDVAFDVED